MKTFYENNKIPMKKQKLSNPSLMGFGTFKVDNSEIIINALRIGYCHLG